MASPSSLVTAALARWRNSLIDLTRRNPLLVLWNRRWLVVGSLALAMLGAIVYLAAATPIYESSASVLETTTKCFRSESPLLARS